ncbi:DUF2158 domain-containing protein [Dyadobacter tibetensis]|uniref:DUF2158 domain-containing protein n=1 Tax=Dyadobacter tibetensis TaxID=1211851 RepID=UPI000470BD91|nr:DUF2158 domain-containing protein [Dyadobacter tibetensis]
MTNRKFQTGDWVKLQQGTQAMTVVDYVNQESEAPNVKCRYTDQDGQSQEDVYKEEELVLLNA